MFSNLEMQPIQYRSERYKSEEGLAELLVASADAATTFDASEEIFDYVAMSIGDLGIVILDPVCLSWGNARRRAEAEEFFAKGLRIEAAVREGQATSEFVHQRFHGPEIVPVAGHEIESDGPAQSIDDRRQFRVRASLGFTNGLSAGAADCVRGILMNLDVRAVHAAHRAAGIAREQREHLQPKATSAPATKPGVDRRPRTKLLGQVSPRLSRPQDEVDAAHHDAVVLRRPAADSQSGYTSSAGAIRSIFLSAPRADRSEPNDLI